MNYSDIKKKYGLGESSSGGKSTTGGSSYSDIANKYGISYSVDENFINAFVTDANSFLGSAEEDYKKVGWGNASSLYQSRYDTWKSLDERYNTIRGWLNSQRDKMDSKTYNDFSAAIDSFGTGAKSVVDSFKSANDYYSQWDSEDSYNRWYEKNEEVREMQDTALGSDDFKEHLQKGKETGQDTHFVWAGVENDTLNLFADLKNDYLISYREDPSLQNDNFNSTNMSTYAGKDATYAQYMTDDEYNTYAYYYGKYGKEKAREYLSKIEETINGRIAGTLVESIGDSTSMKMVFAAAAGLDQFGTGIKNFFSNEDYYVSTPTQIASGVIRDSLSDTGAQLPDWLGGGSLGQLGYDMINTTANMLPSILISNIPVAGAVLGSVSLGASASGNAYAEMINLGYDKSQARAYSLLVGGSEAALQYALGGIGKLGGKLSGKAIGSFVNKFDNALARTAIKLGGNMASEGLEEAIQEVLDPVFKSITTGEDFEGVDWDQVLYSGLLGTLSAGVLEGAGTVSGEVGTYKTGKSVKDAGGVEKLTKLGSSLSADTVAYKIAGKVNESTGAYTIGRLYQEVGATISEQNAADIAVALEKKGMSSKVAKKLAKQYQSFLNGEMELTDAQVAVMENLDPLSDVLRKNIIGQNTTVYQRTRAYSDVMNAEDIVADVAVAQSNAAPLSNEEVARRRALAESGDIEAIAREIASQGTSVKAEAQNASERKFTTSDDGKTVLIDTNEEVKIQGIASIENGKVKLRTNKGEVDAENISFGTENEALLYEAVTDMTPEAARNMVDAYDPSAGVSTSDYIHGFKDSYKYGFFGFAETELAKGTFTKDLSEAQRHIAYTVGKNAGEAVVKEAQKARTEAKKGDKAAPKKGKVFINGKEYNLGDKTGLRGIRDDSVKGTAALTHSIGVKTYFYESYLDKNGNRVYRDADGTVKKAPHGFYDPTDGSIHIDLNAGKMGEGVILYTVAHEMTHFIRDWSPAKFKVFADFLLENYAKKGVSVEALVQGQIQKAAKNGRELSFDEAYEEVVADSCQAMLADGNAIKKIADLKAKDATLWQKTKDFLSGIVAKIKKAYAGLDPYSDEGRFVKNQLDNFEQLQSMWVDALVDAGETYSAIGGMVQADASSQSVAPMMSERTWTESEYVQAREATAKKMSKDLGVSLKTAYKYIDDINSVARLISDDRARLDYEPNLDNTATVIKPNSDYKWSVDMSTLCAKRLLFTGTFDAIQRALPNTAFDSDDIVRIRGMMEERGYEVACGICYVESTRREIGTITADFIERYKEAQKTGKPITRINSEGKAVELHKTKDQMETTADASTNQFFADKDYTPTLAELNTTDIDLVKRDHPLVYEAYLNYMNARGQAKPKLLETRAEYKGEILKHFKYKSAVTSRNTAGGLRLQSFSDFEVPHLIDMMQITMDMARVGLKSQAYTKVPNFAEAFGNTGIKINLSLIAKGTGLDADGNLIFDDKEGINHTEAFRLRDKFSKNVGTILVGKNDAHIIAAMADPRIDYIIPFHKSSWKESLYDALGLTGYADYTATQGEKPIDNTRTIKDFDPSEYWDFSKTGDENAQIYLEKCREDGRIPKFPQFQGYEGYWKLLIDFKMYDNDGVGSPQEVVQPIFDNAVNERILAEYEGGHRSFPVAKDVVDDFVKEKKKDMKLSDRDSEGNTLSAEQQEFFKDSKVRDKKGRLLRLYHGTDSDITVFDESFSQDGTSLFLTDSKYVASTYTTTDKTMPLYANLVNPLIVDAKGKDSYHIPVPKELEYMQLGKVAEARQLAYYAKGMGYDGVIIKNVIDVAGFATPRKATDVIAFNSEQIKDIGNKAPTSNPDIRYSGREFSEDFTSETLDGFGIEKLGDYIHVQRQVFNTLLNEGFFTDSEKRGRTDVNEESGMEVEINKSGIFETFSLNNYGRLGKFKKIAKLATIRSLPDAIKHGHIITDDAENIHNDGDNKKFAYIEYPTIVDGKDIVLKIAIKKSPQKNKFWVHSIYTTENVSDSPASTSNGTEAGHITADTEVIISQDSDSVKREFSDRDSTAASDFVTHMRSVIQGRGTWYVSDVFDYVASNPDLNFIERIFYKDKTVKSDLESLLEGIDDAKLLHDFSWYMGEAYARKAKRYDVHGKLTSPYQGAVRTFRNAIKKRTNEIMSAKVGGTNLGVKNGDVSLDDIKSLFDRLNSNDELSALAEKVFATAERLGVNIRFANQTFSKGVGGDALGDMIEFKTAYFNDAAYTDQRKAQTILHELIHTCTVYVMQANGTFAGDVHYGSDKTYNYERISNAATRLNRIYSVIVNDPDFHGMYGIKNAKEMVAELANPNFVELLKKKTLWQQVLDWICELFGFSRGTSAYDNAMQCLDYILDNPEVSAYKEYALAARRTANRKYGGAFGSTVLADGQVRYSDRDSYAPVFYSHMGKVIDDIKISKMGAGGVVPYLKGRGVKDEEIKWSGIEAFLEGKKSVTKEELQEFVAGSQLQIVEQMTADEGNAEIVLYQSPQPDVKVLYIDGKKEDIFRRNESGFWVSDELGDMFFDEQEIIDQVKSDYARNVANTNWSQYKLDGGTNYRELVFQMPNSSYSNKAMRVHWGEDAEGVLAHARIQDIDTSDGKMLFIEEIQSDWHNEGGKKGYVDKTKEVTVKSTTVKHEDGVYRLYRGERELYAHISDATLKNRFPNGITEEEIHQGLVDKHNGDLQKAGATPDAPFRDTYHEYVLKRLIRMAAEEGYDIIGWTPSEIQVDRWSEEFAEGYRIEYDQDMPKFLRKYGKKWGATVGSTTINGTEVWSMPITDSMKQSVLHEGQPLYSDRSESDISNRELLANAMEAAAQNDIERRKLALYKEKIALINAEEKHLHELKEKIGELSFAKGKKDVEQIKKLQFEAKQTENRINTYDRQLLSLEASAPLKAVLEREKKLAYKKAEQRGKDALAAYREKAAKTQRALLEKARESRQKGIEGRRKTEMRHKIKKVVSDLDQLLRHGSKDRNVKLGLQAAVASALEAVNMDTIAADERIAKLEKELMQAKTPEKIQEISRKIDHIRDQGDRMASRLEELRRAYADIKNSDQGVPDYYKNEASLIADRVDSVMNKVGDTPLRNMSLSQLDEVYNLYKIVLTTVRNVNSLFVQGKLDDLHQNASAIMQEEEAIKPLKEERLAIGDWWRKQAWNEMIPVYAFERLGSKTLTKFFWETIKGQNTFATDIAEAKEFSKAAREKFGYAKWDLDKIHEFNLEDGRTFRVSLRHMMSIYAYSKREQALDHMRVGGFFFNDKSTFRKEKGILKVIKSNEAGYTVSEDVFQAIRAAMTEEQIHYVDEMQDYLTKMGEKGNEVSRVLWGIDIFKEKVYFPLKSSHDFIYQANQPAQESSLKNDGMTKETIPHASNPIVLEEFDDVWASHIERMSKYHAFVLPIENLNKLMNYGTWVGTDSMSVSTMIRARHSDAANEYITQFIRDLNGASSMDGVSNPVFGFFNKFKKTAVAASLSVVVQQPTAILRASAVLDPKYFVGKPTLKSLPSKWEELQKYAPIAIIKDIGGFDAGGGRQIAEWLNADTKRGLEKVMGKVDDITMLGAALGDQVGWTAIWEAVKRETVHNHPNIRPNSEEFLKLAGERFTEVIVLTQVYDSTLSRSGFMRSKHESVKMMTSFMGEPTVSFNMLMDAVMQAKGKKITKRQAARTVGAVYASVVAAAVAASMIYALRDDDDDEAYLEKLAESLSGKLKDEINPLNMLPIMRDIISIMDGWDVERTDVAIFKDLKDAFDGLSSENKSAWRKVEDFAGAIASTFGVPLKNVLRTGREIYNLFENIFDSDAPTGAGIKNSIAAGITGKEKSNGQQLYEAILNGDQKQIDRVKGRFDNQTAIDTALRKALRENDPRVKEAAEAIIDEDFSKYTKIANEIVNEGYFSEANIVAAIKSEINAMTEDEDETEETEDKEVSIYEMDYFYSAVVGGDTVMAHAIREDIIRTKVANGKDREDAEKNFNSSFASRCREEYEAGSLSDGEAVRMLVSYGGKTEAEAQAKVQYWDFKQGNPDTYVSEYWIDAYNEDVASSGVSLETFIGYKNAIKDIEGDGAKERKMAVIHSLPISNAQKDALYFSEGWAASKLYEAPWR